MPLRCCFDCVPASVPTTLARCHLVTVLQIHRESGLSNDNIRIQRMSADGRLLPFTNATFRFGERPLVGGSGHRNFDAKPRVYEFVSGCLGSFPAIGNPTLSVRSNTD